MAPRAPVREMTTTLLAAASLFSALAEAQFINSFAGPFDVNLDRVESCPPSANSLDLVNYTHRLIRDRRYPKRFYYSGVIQHFFDISRTMAGAVALSSWSARGGWKDNAYNHKFERVCEMVMTWMKPHLKRLFEAATGRKVECPFPASRWEFTNFPVDVSPGPFTNFVYGKWRIQIKTYEGESLLTCLLEFVETVPKVHSRGSPDAANYTDTVRITPGPHFFP